MHGALRTAADSLEHAGAPGRIVYQTGWTRTVQQADTSRTRIHGGLGLGLTIVRQLAESHGGTVQATSSGGEQGATFIVKLPLRSSARSAAQ